MSARMYLRGFLSLFAIAVIGALLHATGWGAAVQSWPAVSSSTPGFGQEIVFVLVGAALTAMGLSRQAVTFLAGYTFGVTGGTVVGLLAAVVGCAAAFWIARTVARDAVSTRLSGRLARFNAFLQHNTFEAIVMLRFLPVGSNLLVNALGGASQARAFPFIAGSAIGYLPQTFIFALIGAGFAVSPDVRVAIGAGLFVVSAGVGIALYRRYRRMHHVSAPDVLGPDSQSSPDR